MFHFNGVIISSNMKFCTVTDWCSIPFSGSSFGPGYWRDSLLGFK